MKLGKIEIAKSVLNAIPNLFSTHLSDFKILMSDPDTGQEKLLYVIECDKFDDLSQDEEIPYYTILFEYNNNSWASGIAERKLTRCIGF